MVQCLDVLIEGHSCKIKVLIKYFLTSIDELGNFTITKKFSLYQNLGISTVFGDSQIAVL